MNQSQPYELVEYLPWHHLPWRWEGWGRGSILAIRASTAKGIGSRMGLWPPSDESNWKLCISVGGKRLSLKEAIWEKNRVWDGERESYWWRRGDPTSSDAWCFQYEPSCVCLFDNCSYSPEQHTRTQVNTTWLRQERWMGGESEKTEDDELTQSRRWGAGTGLMRWLVKQNRICSELVRKRCFLPHLPSPWSRDQERVIQLKKRIVWALIFSGNQATIIIFTYFYIHVETGISRKQENKGQREKGRHVHSQWRRRKKTVWSHCD